MAYGPSLMQVLPLEVPELHALGLDGSTVRIAVLDTGFKLHHEAIGGARERRRILDLARGLRTSGHYLGLLVP